MKIACLLLLALVISSIPVAFKLPKVSGVSAQVYVSPGNNIFYTDTTPVNSRFNVTVWVQDVSDLACWQVQMNYDSSILNLTRVWQPQWDTQYVFYGRANYPNVYYNANYVTLGDVLVPLTQPRFAGSGKLCILEFQIIAKPQKGGELSSMLDIIQGSWTYLLDPNTDQIPLTQINGNYTYIDSFEAFSGFKTLFVNNSVHMVYPSDSPNKPLGCGAAMVCDWTASAFIYSLLNHATEGLDTDAAFVSQTTGKPQGSSGMGIISFGGPFVNLVVSYAENAATTPGDRAPIKFYASGDVFGFQCGNGTKVQGAALGVSHINNDKDMFVIEMYQDGNGKCIMLFYGLGWKGTYAAGKYFFTTIYPALQSHSESWIIVKWEDTNGNGFVDTGSEGDTYTVIARNN